MVTTDEIGMVCDECGGRCPAYTDNYDDVMHLPGCKHRAVLDVWANHPELHNAAHNGMLCAKYMRSVMDFTNAPFARSCPAHFMLFDALPNALLETDSPIGCDHREECYCDLYSKFEEEVLTMADWWEINETVNAVDNFIAQAE